ncbi:MAG: hypothetical protein IPJ30_04625 [Acidobacteria bacterium]|nr:hypothetical protein [Acidobacteriota bacterium]
MAGDDDPEQGWKLHVSATVLEACSVFKSVAGFLSGANVQFKVPKSLKELELINTGLGFGYSQVGKFITIYPRTDSEAIEIAAAVHDLTIGFIPISVPFDRQFCPGSNVHLRYGAFEMLECETKAGKMVPAIRDPNGNLVPDDRFSVAPSWINDPFPAGETATSKSFENTPLGTRYRIFSAISQRGKAAFILRSMLSV